MVQVLQRSKKPDSFKEAIAGFSESLSDMAIEKEKSKQLQQENQSIKQNFGIDLSDINDPKQRQMILGELMKQSSKNQLQQDKMSYLDKLFGSNQNQSRNMAQEGSLLDSDQQSQNNNKFNAENISDEDILRASSIDPVIGRELRSAKDSALERQRHKTGLEEKEIAASRKETMPIRKQYADQAKFAKEAVKNKQLQLDLIRRGNVDNPETVFFASLLPGALGNKILSADTQLYKAGLFEEFGVLKSMFPGQIRVKEIELLEDKLASLEKNHEAKEKILETGIDKLQIPQIKSRAAQKVEKNHPKASLLEFEELVDKYAQEDLDKAYNNIKKSYEKIYFDYSPEINNLMDQNGNIYRDVPKKDLKKLYEEAEKEGLELKPY